MNGLEYIAESWKGVQKAENQDAYHIISNDIYTLFFIFDGVSTSPFSAEGIRELIDFCNENYQLYYRDGDFHLSELIEDMNIFLIRTKLKSAETTCAILFFPLAGDQAKITHLGDSRIYHFKGGEFFPLTVDDSHSEIKHMLTKCLGLPRLGKDDFYEKKIKLNGEGYLFCTDGFYHVMENFPDEFRDSFLYYKDLGILKKKIESLVRFKNGDDATYIYLKHLVE